MVIIIKNKPNDKYFCDGCGREFTNSDLNECIICGGFFCVECGEYSDDGFCCEHDI